MTYKQGFEGWGENGTVLVNNTILHPWQTGNTGTVTVITGFTQKGIRCAGGSFITYRTNRGSSVNAVQSGVFGFRFRVSATGGNINLCALLNSGAMTQLQARVTPTRQIQIQNNVPTALFTSSINVVTANTWHYLELVFNIANSGGSVSVYLDGVLLGTFNGDTQSQTEDTVARARLRSSAGVNVDFDDMYFTDETTPLGPIRVYVKRQLRKQFLYQKLRR
jgi:hypothetical protein